MRIVLDRLHDGARHLRTGLSGAASLSRSTPSCSLTARAAWRRSFAGPRLIGRTLCLVAALVVAFLLPAHLEHPDLDHIAAPTHVSMGAQLDHHHDPASEGEIALHASGHVIGNPPQGETVVAKLGVTKAAWPALLAQRPPSRIPATDAPVPRA